MQTDKKLTKEQKENLALLEPKLKLCVKFADFENAKKITAKIQILLRESGHETRLLQAKNWLYETAMEANNITFARMGFEGNIQKSSEYTRLNLEATSLLAICYLREQNISKAQELIIKAVNKINNIKSDEKRKQFHQRLLQRLEEESILLGLIDKKASLLEIEKVDNETIKLVRSKSENEILEEMGNIVPLKTIDLLLEIRKTYQLKLSASDKVFLPAPLTKESKIELGKRTNSALKHVAWKALCNPDNEIYKAWTNGLSVVYDKKYITGAIVASFNSVSISTTMIAASVAALAIKFGAEVFCEIFAPKSIMIDRNDKS